MGSTALRIALWVVLICATLAGNFFAQRQLMRLHQQARQQTQALSQPLAQAIAQALPTQTIDRLFLQQLAALDPHLAYLIYTDANLAAPVAIVLQERWHEALPFVRRTFFSQDIQQQAAHRMQAGMGGAAPGLLVFQVELLATTPTATATTPPRLKVGYLITDFRYYQYLAWALQLLLALQLIALGGLWWRRTPKSRRRRRTRQLAAEHNEVDLFAPSQTADADDTEIISITPPPHVTGEQWIPMLGAEGLGHWQKRGSWFLVNDYIYANPWSASLVRTDFDFLDYIYRVKAKSIIGADGFIVLFTCDSQSLVWVFGGWGNSRSEVAGIAATRVAGSIEPGRWYEVTVEVLADNITGYLNGEKQWSIPRHGLKSQSFSKEFLSGIGVATWSSVCKFKDPLIVNKTNDDDKDKTES